MGSIHGFHCESELGNVFGVEYCRLSPHSRGTCRVPSRCSPHEDCSNMSRCVGHWRGSVVGGIFIIELIIIEGETVPIRVFLERWDTSRYLVNVRAWKSVTLAIVFQCGSRVGRACVVNIPIYSPCSLLFLVSITFLISFRLLLFKLYYLEATSTFLHFFPSRTLLI